MLIPKETFGKYRLQAQDMWRDGKPQKWYYALPILVVWAIILFVLAKLIFRF